jgi:hypothetical protein
MADEARGVEAEHDEAGVRGRVIRAFGTLLGALSLVAGLTWVLIYLSAPSIDLVVGVVLALGGLVLLMPHRMRLPRAATWIAAVVAGLGGTAAGIAAGTTTACCMFAYVVDRGFPYPWLQRGGVADDPEVARRLAATDAWQADVPTLLINVLVWAYAGILVVSLVVLVRRTARKSVGALP